jgi:gamma-glutamyl:cysteine ligase YbdK (ATP-grasp superfamily)
LVSVSHSASVLSSEEVEKIMPLANAADILVRDTSIGPQKLLDALITDANPIELLRKMSAEKKYPPVEIANKITDVRKGYRAVLVDLTSLDDSTKAQLQAWIFKTMEAIAQKHRVDYVVAIAEARDRQTNRVVPTVQVIRYWLSNAVAPKKLVNTSGLTVIGHDDAFSIRALDIDSARMLATNMFNDLELASPRTTRLVNEQIMAQAVESDFRALISKISQIAEQQSQLQKEIKEVKSEQEEIKKFLEMERRRSTLLSKATE